MSHRDRRVSDCDIKFPLVFRRCWQLCFIAALATLGLLQALAHETTRRAHEASLDPRETKALANGRSIAGVFPPSVAPAPLCQLTIRLLDANTRKPLPGLVRITQSDGNVLFLARLISRGTKLRNDHPAKDWFALIEPIAIAVERGVLTIEGFSGLDTELARVTVDLSGKPSAEVDLPLKSFAHVGDTGWFSGNTHLHLSGLT